MNMKEEKEEEKKARVGNSTRHLREIRESVTDGWTDEWTDGWMDGWTDRQTDGRTKPLRLIELRVHN